MVVRPSTKEISLTPCSDIHRTAFLVQLLSTIHGYPEDQMGKRQPDFLDKGRYTGIIKNKCNNAKVICFILLGA